MGMSKQQMPKPGDLVELYWWDHSGRDSWIDKGESVEIIECRSIGWVEAVNKQSICTYASETNRDKVSEQSNIVRKCLTRINILQHAKAAAPKWTKK